VIDGYYRPQSGDNVSVPSLMIELLSITIHLRILSILESMFHHSFVLKSQKMEGEQNI